MNSDRIAERLRAGLGRPIDLAARRLAALGGASQGRLGGLSLGMAHAWQRVAGSQTRGRRTPEVTVLFTDLVGYSDWTLQSGDTLAIRLLDEVSEAIEPPICDRKGEVVKRLGDGLMAVFPDASSAVDAAFEARERATSIKMDGFQPLLKTGIHLGRPRKVGDDYLGVDVNIAARLLEAAKPGEILVSHPTLRALDAVRVPAAKRRLHATGLPTDFAAYVF
jgi:adenylate cyclase